VVLPLELRHTRRAEPLACLEHLVAGGQSEAEVVGARECLGGRITGGERQQRPVAIGQDEQVLVVVDAPREAEVLGVERGGAVAVRDGQGDVVERQI
jgi:hypothetical protein